MSKPDIEALEGPVWKDTLYVRSLTGFERAQFEKRINADVNSKQLYAEFAALVLCDKAGHRLFADNNLEFLHRKSLASLKRVFEEWQQINDRGVIA